ncbi:MAG: DUF1269 domain-containing protein [Anaerolineae bacterium]
MAKESSNSVYHILAFSFEGEKTAATAAELLKDRRKEEQYKIVAWATVRVDEKGKVHTHEPGHGGIGAGAGLVAGGLLGLIGGPAGLLLWALGGALIGGSIGHFVGRSIPQEDLKELGLRLKPNSSAILALVEDKGAEGLIDEMKGEHAQVLTMTFGDQASGVIEQAVIADGEVAADDGKAEAAPARAAAAATADDGKKAGA